MSETALSSVTRINISLRESTKRRMDSLRDAALVDNWSELIDSLILAKCDEVELAAGAAGPDGVAARLRASLDFDGESTIRARNDEHMAGLNAGRVWARLHARPFQLATIEVEIWPKLLDGSYCYESGSPSVALAVFYDLNTIRYSWSDPERAIDFWRQQIGDPFAEVTTGFAWGFVSGAYDEWREAKPHFYRATKGINLDPYGFSIGPEPDLMTTIRVRPPRLAKHWTEESIEAQESSIDPAEVTRKLSAAEAAVSKPTPRKNRKRRD